METEWLAVLVVRRHLRAEFISEAEPKAKLREAGAADYAEIESAYMESDGKITVTKKRPTSSGGHGGRPSKSRA